MPINPKKRNDIGGARRLTQSASEPSPTIMAGGIGSVNTSQYHVASDVQCESKKPEYLVPSMKEITKIPWNGLIAASTFSGCGGSSLGYKMAGFEVAWASEFVEAARDSYRANMVPGTVLDERDIRSVKPEDLLKSLGIRLGDLDLLDGSPPCASFSTAGKRQGGWGKVKKYSDTKQRTDDLFFEFVRILRGVMPRTFVAENVSGLVKGVAKGYFLEILDALKASGYRVSCKMLDAQWLGVPQARQRIIFVGVRNDMKCDNGLLAPVHPNPIAYRYSIRDAIPWIDSNTFRHVEPEADMNRFATGREWDNIGRGGQSEKYFQLVKPSVGEPCPTITANGGQAGLASVCHPKEKRKFSIEELKRICSFPDDFFLTGSYIQQWERLGRAVPPLMMKAVADVVRDQILVPGIGEDTVKRRIASRRIKPLMIGQAPSAITDAAIGRKAFSGMSGSRLAIFLRVSLDKLLSSTEAINLLDRFPGRNSEKGDDFDHRAASRAASLINLANRKAILVGRRVAEAFNLSDMKFLEVRKIGNTQVLLLPHPSGVNSWWNEQFNVDGAVKAMRQMLMWE